MVVILLYGIYYGAAQLSNQPEFSYLAGILDPFGIQAINHSQVGLSSDQLNSDVSASNHVVLFNRIFWSIIGIISCFLAYFRFSFQYSLKKRKEKKTKTSANEKLIAESGKLQLTQSVNTLFNASARLKQFFFLIKYEWSLLFKNFYFRIILLIGLVLLIISSMAIGEMYDTNTYPVAYNVADVLLGATKLFLFAIITIFSGEMVWRDRSLKTHYVGDALPIRTSEKYFSKVVALTAFVFIAHVFFIAFGVFIQYLNGYTNYEVSLLAQLILGIGFTSTLFTIGLAFAVQAVVKNRFVGYFIMIAYFSFQNFLAGSILEDNTFSFNSSPFIQYSDMNGFGYNMPIFVLFKTYWLLFVALLLVIALKLYPSGIDIRFKTRLNELKRQFRNSTYKYGVTTLSIAFVLFGSFIFYNIHARNTYESSHDQEKKMVAYETQFSEYKGKVEPVISNVSIDAELYPENGSMHANGFYWLKNKSNIPLSEICVGPSETDSLWFSGESTLKVNTPEFKVYQLSTPLASDDSLQLYFTINSSPEGFANHGIRSLVDKNGTFFNSDIFPRSVTMKTLNFKQTVDVGNMD